MELRGDYRVNVMLEMLNFQRKLFLHSRPVPFIATRGFKNTIQDRISKTFQSSEYVSIHNFNLPVQLYTILVSHGSDRPRV